MSLDSYSSEESSSSEEEEENNNEDYADILTDILGILFLTQKKEQEQKKK